MGRLSFCGWSGSRDSFDNVVLLFGRSCLELLLEENGGLQTSEMSFTFAKVLPSPIIEV